MADGKNEARALRIVELTTNYRADQARITSDLSRREANPTDDASRILMGYELISKLKTQAEPILSRRIDPDDMQPPSPVPDTEVQKAMLQRRILDHSARRWKAHKVSMQITAAVNWARFYQQAKRQDEDQQAHLLQTIEQNLRRQMDAITDQHVHDVLRVSDLNNKYWIDEDPSLQRIQAWLQQQA